MEEPYYSYPCGSSTHEIDMICSNKNDAKNEQDEHCTRTYHLYVPCTTSTSTGTNRASTSKSATASTKNSSYSAAAAHLPQPDIDIGFLPVIYALHCYGGDASAMKKWESIAQQFNFILVRPEGIQQSWNAKYCCGYALENNLNDSGFLQLILDQIMERSMHARRDMVYGLGWSNGAYMVSLMAHMFRSIVPIAGYQYEDIEINTGNVPTGIFQHHSLNDPVVRYGGCCMVDANKDADYYTIANATAKNKTNKTSCCCGIQSDQCHSVDATFDIWTKEVNQCTSGTTTVYKDIKRGIECRSGNGCSANTTLCVYENKKHFGSPSFSRAFPMFKEVGHFFARDACFLNGGVWDMEQKFCVCNAGSEKDNGNDSSTQGTIVRSGIYCSSGRMDGNPTSDATHERTSNTSTSISNGVLHPDVFGPVASAEWMALLTVIVIMIAVTGGAIFGYKRRRMNGKMKMTPSESCRAIKKNEEIERLIVYNPTEGVELTSR